VHYFCHIRQVETDGSSANRLGQELADSGPLVWSADAREAVHLVVNRGELTFGDARVAESTGNSVFAIVEARDLNHAHRILSALSLAESADVRLYPLDVAIKVPRNTHSS
jgi:hypothetical protein